MFLVFGSKPATAQTEIPMQLCSPISTGDCAVAPHWVWPPAMKLPRRSGGLQPEGEVGLDAVGGVDGSVHHIEIEKSSDDELKEDVNASFQKWKFAPATFQGRPAAVEISVVVQFRAVGSPSVSFGPKRASWATIGELQKLFDQASQAYGRRDYQKAVAVSRQLLALDPLFKRIRLLLGDALVELKQYEDAETVLQARSEKSIRLQLSRVGLSAPLQI
jgi:hypothetical protein